MLTAAWLPSNPPENVPAWFDDAKRQSLRKYSALLPRGVIEADEAEESSFEGVGPAGRAVPKTRDKALERPSGCGDPVSGVTPGRVDHAGRSSPTRR